MALLEKSMSLPQDLTFSAVVKYTTPSGHTPIPPWIVNIQIIKQPVIAATKLSMFFLMDKNGGINPGMKCNLE